MSFDRVSFSFKPFQDSLHLFCSRNFPTTARDKRQTYFTPQPINHPSRGFNLLRSTTKTKTLSIFFTFWKMMKSHKNTWKKIRRLLPFQPQQMKLRDRLKANSIIFSSFSVCVLGSSQCYWLFCRDLAKFYWSFCVYLSWWQRIWGCIAGTWSKQVESKCHWQLQVLWEVSSSNFPSDFLIWIFIALSGHHLTKGFNDRPQDTVNISSP